VRPALEAESAVRLAELRKRVPNADVYWVNAVNERKESLHLLSDMKTLVFQGKHFHLNGDPNRNQSQPSPTLVVARAADRNSAVTIDPADSPIWHPGETGLPEPSMPDRSTEHSRALFHANKLLPGADRIFVTPNVGGNQVFMYPLALVDALSARNQGPGLATRVFAGSRPSADHFIALQLGNAGGERVDLDSTQHQALFFSIPADPRLRP
jgi:hypothetical protein